VGNRVFSFSTRDPEVAGIRDSIELCTADNLRKQELARVRYIARKSNTRWLSGKGDSVITYCFYEKTKAVKPKYSEDSRTPRIASALATLIKLAQNFEATKVGAPTIGVYKSKRNLTLNRATLTITGTLSSNSAASSLGSNSPVKSNSNPSGPPENSRRSI